MGDAHQELPGGKRLNQAHVILALKRVKGVEFKGNSFKPINTIDFKLWIDVALTM